MWPRFVTTVHRLPSLDGRGPFAFGLSPTDIFFCILLLAPSPTPRAVVLARDLLLMLASNNVPVVRGEKDGTTQFLMYWIAQRAQRAQSSIPQDQGRPIHLSQLGQDQIETNFCIFEAFWHKATMEPNFERNSFSSYIFAMKSTMQTKLFRRNSSYLANNSVTKYLLFSEALSTLSLAGRQSTPIWSWTFKLFSTGKSPVTH